MLDKIKTNQFLENIFSLSSTIPKNELVGEVIKKWRANELKHNYKYTPNGDLLYQYVEKLIPYNMFKRKLKEVVLKPYITFDDVKVATSTIFDYNPMLGVSSNGIYKFTSEQPGSVISSQYSIKREYERNYKFGRFIVHELETLDKRHLLVWLDHRKTKIQEKGIIIGVVKKHHLSTNGDNQTIIKTVKFSDKEYFDKKGNIHMNIFKERIGDFSIYKVFDKKEYHIVKNGLLIKRFYILKKASEYVTSLS